MFDIKDIHTSDAEGVKETLEEYGSLGQEMYPIQIKDKKFLIDKYAIIENKELFKAICNGYTIDLSATKNEKGES